MTFACHSTYRPATQIVFSPRQPLENSGPMRLPFGWIPERVFPHRSYRGQEQGDREPLDFGLLIFHRSPSKKPIAVAYVPFLKWIQPKVSAIPGSLGFASRAFC